MDRRIAIVGAPTSIGIRPYDSGETRHLDRAPGVLRELGLVERLGAADLGDVIPLPYRDYVRPPGRARNEAEVTAYCRALGERVGSATGDGGFAVVLGGDCSIVLGSLLGARGSAQGSVGLVYVDAHADFATPESPTPVPSPACASGLPSVEARPRWLGSPGTNLSCMASMSW